MSRPLELSGKHFGRLTVVERDGSDKKGDSLWLCKCDCGNEAIVRGYLLKNGKTQSCGCLLHEAIIKNNHLLKRTHGETRTRLYHIWSGIKERCLNKNSKHYPDYGGRGITICVEWKSCYENFRNWSRQHGYTDKLTIDRINNDGSYEPDNCRWTTMSVQNSNRRHYKWKKDVVKK